MSIEMRSIRCHHARATREPCTNPAVVEVLGPAPYLLCAEHAAGEFQVGPDLAHEEGWEEFGAERYARHCEDALDALEGAARANGGDGQSDDNPILGLILEEATTYLEEYELERARRVLEARGGERRETGRERKFREVFERQFGKRTAEPGSGAGGEASCA